MEVFFYVEGIGLHSHKQTRLKTKRIVYALHTQDRKSWEDDGNWDITSLEYTNIRWMKIKKKNQIKFYYEYINEIRQGWNAIGVSISMLDTQYSSGNSYFEQERGATKKYKNISAESRDTHVQKTAW